MQQDMKKSSIPIFDNMFLDADNFMYHSDIHDYFSLDHKCNSYWTSNVGDSHSHTFCEIVVYMQDLKCLFVNDTMYVSEAPCIFTFRPGESHYAIHSNSKRHERFMMYLFQENLFGIPGGREMLRCLFDRSAGEHNMIVLPEEEQSEAFRLLNHILSQDVHEHPECQSLMLADLIQFLSILNRYYLSDITHRTDGMSELLRQILTYIGNNLTENLKISALARQFKISQSTLERLFRHSLMMSPREYIIRRRMEAARNYLRQGQSVTDACNNAGFGDYSHFIADFRRFNGITPAEYAKQHRHEAENYILQRDSSHYLTNTSEYDIMNISEVK